MKVPLKDIYDDLNFATDRLSAQVRTLVLGILALVWAFLSSNKDVLPLKLGASKEPLVLIGAICILTLVLDLLQYMCSYVSANRVRRRAEAGHQDTAEYDEASGVRLLQRFLFWAKQITTLGAAAWLLTLILVTVW
jgi:hypothetical protein